MEIEHDVFTIRHDLHGNDIYLRYAEEAAFLAGELTQLVECVRARNPKGLSLEACMEQCRSRSAAVVAAMIAADLYPDDHKVEQYERQWAERLGGTQR